MGRRDSLSRIIKLASASPTGDPGTDAMAAAAQAAKGPAGMPLLKMPKPGKDEESTMGQDAIRLAHELDAKTKEINGLRTQLQEAKFDTMRTQMKADIAAEQTKMRESLRQEQQKMYEKIRGEQKELDKQQSQLQMSEAETKANNIAATAQHNADITAAEAQHKANIAIAEAQHKAQLDKDVSEHDAEIAQHKADSLMDIAERTTDMYVKQTDKARADADKYFAGQDKQYKSTHPVVSPALQNRLDGAMQSVSRVSKALAAMQAKQAAFFVKYATEQQTQQQQQPQQQATYNPSGADAMYEKMRNASNPAGVTYSSTTNQPMPNSGTLPESKYYNPQQEGQTTAADSYFQRYMPQDTENVVDYAKALASQENELYRLKATGANPQQIAEFQKRYAQAKRDFEDLKARTQSAAKGGDLDAREQLAQLGDASDDSGMWWWHEESDLDKIRNQYKNQQEEANHTWLYKGMRGLLGLVDPVGPLARAISDEMRVNRMYGRRGAERVWFGNNTDTGGMAAQRAAEMRGLHTSILGGVAGVGLGALEGPGLLAANIATAGSLGTAAKVGLKAYRMARTAQRAGKLAKGTSVWGQTGKAVGKELVGYNSAQAAKSKELMQQAYQANQYGKTAWNGFKYGYQSLPGRIAISPVMGTPGFTYMAGQDFVDNYKHGRIDANGNYMQGNEPLMYLNQNGRAEMGNGYAYDEYGNYVNGQWGNSPRQFRGFTKSSSAMNKFMEKWGKTERILDSDQLDAQSFQNDPYWLERSDEGAYQYGLLNMLAPFAPGLLGLEIHPSRPILPNKGKRIDPLKVQEAYLSGIPNRDTFLSDVGRDVTARWAEYQGIDPRYTVPIGAH